MKERKDDEIWEESEKETVEQIHSERALIMNYTKAD